MFYLTVIQCYLHTHIEPQLPWQSQGKVLSCCTAEKAPQKYKYNLATFQPCKQTRPPKFPIRACDEGRKWGRQEENTPSS